MADFLVQAGTTTLSGIADLNVLRIMEGSQSITGSVDQTGLASGLGGVDVRRPFTGNIGAPTGALKCFCATAGRPVRYDAGGGNLYLHGSGTTSTIARWIIAGGGTGHAIDGMFTTVEIASGGFQGKAAANIRYLYVGGGHTDLEYISSAINIPLIDGGANVWCERPLSGTTRLFSGTFTLGRKNTTTTSAHALSATIIVGPGATLKWLGGSLGNLWISEYANIDFASAPYALTIGNLYGTPRAIDRARIPTTNRAGATITVSNTHPYGGYSGWTYFGGGGTVGE